MNAKTLAALEASIAKWKRNAQAMAPGDYLIGPRECHLCVLFNRDNCQGCPVKARTGETYCDGTPYHLAANLLNKWWMTGDPADGQKARDAAREEVAFLESLLPASDALTEIKKLGGRVCNIKAESADQIAALEARVKALSEALEFYADRGLGGYEVFITDYGLSIEAGEIIKDGGERARAALQENTDDR